MALDKKTQKGFIKNPKQNV